MFSNYNGYFKNFFRQEVINYGKQKVGLSKTALFLPGEHLKCLKLALDNGLVDKDTFIITIEEKPSINSIIIQYLRQNFKYFYPYKGKAEQFDITEELKLIRQPILPIDFCFLDFCGEITLNKYNWLKYQLSPHLNSKSACVYTFSLKFRNNSLAQDDSLWDNCMEDFWGDKYPSVVNVPSGKTFNNAIITLRLLRKTYKGKIERSYSYSDTNTPMFLVFASSTRDPNRTQAQAARKAWETRKSRYGYVGHKCKVSPILS